MPRPRHAQIYAGMQEKIKETAWELMNEVGAAKFSMRELGRRMGLSAPALYNYFANQDDLLTVLLLEAFNSLADAMESAQQSAQTSTGYHQLMLVAAAYRRWAIANRTKYYLIYGTPIMGYTAPQAVTVPAAVRIFAVLTGIIEQAIQSGELVTTSYYAAVPEKQAVILQTLITENHYPVSTRAIFLGFKCWYHLYGLVMPALLDHLMPLDTADFFQTETEILGKIIGFKT